MSKKYARQQQKPRLPQRKSRGRHKAVVVIGLILCLGLTSLILAQWRASHIAGMTTAALLPQANPTLSKEYIYAGGKLVATEEPQASPSAPANAAAFISQSVPSSMISGQTYNVSVTMKNTGSNTWTSATLHRLGAQNPQDNSTWRPSSRVNLPSSVAPNSEVTFAFTVTAPSTAGIYNFKWRMVQDEVEWFGDASTNVPVAVSTSDRINFALASNGGVATASSSYSSSYNAGRANNGDRKGPGAGGNGDYWNDTGQNTFPEWLEIDFSGAKAIDEIDLFCLQDNYSSPSTPTETMTFSLYGLTSFEVQYWTGSAWMNIPGGSVSGNNLVWRKFTFPSITTSKVRVLVNASPDGYSRVTELEAWGYNSSVASTNVALASNGGVASSSSSYSGGFPPARANNGDRKGPGSNGDGDYWNDATANTFPDWLEVDFNGAKVIHEIDLFCLQDSYANPSDPTAAMTFSLYGLTGFDVQYWNGTTWATVSGGQVTGNNKVWRKFNFAEVTTTKIRVLSTSTPDGWSRITELEAWGFDAPPTGTNVALSSNGAVATASSSYSSDYSASRAINGDRKGPGLSGDGDYWNDNSGNTFPDWLQIEFNAQKTIHEIDLFMLQDSYWAPSDPTASMTFTYYGLTDFKVQYWNGTAWADVAGGNVTSNNKVWRRFIFANISTTKIRVLSTSTPDGWSRLTEVEAWGN